MAEWYPAQGEWSEEEYLTLDVGRLIEFEDGCLEFLPMPTLEHQWIVLQICRVLEDFVKAHRLGVVVPAPSPVRLRPGKYREPDVVFARSERITSMQSPPNGADLVVEVVSEGVANRRRDTETKRREYAAAGIAEYWIVDPRERRVTILTLAGDKYVVAAKVGVRSQAKSVLLEGFEVSVADLFKPHP